jgi:hypothetical protein
VRLGVRLGLDGLTVLITTALFLWHLALRPMVERHTAVRLAPGPLMLATTCLVALTTLVNRAHFTELLRSPGYRFGQGYLYARPLAPHDVAALSTPALIGRRSSI